MKEKKLKNTKILNHLFPDEIFYSIFQFCNYKEITFLERTCTHFCNLVSKIEIWKNIAVKNYSRLSEIALNSIGDYKNAIKELRKEESLLQKGNVKLSGIFLDIKGQIEDSIFLFDLNLINTSENKVEGIILWELFHDEHPSFSHQIGQKGVEIVSGEIKDNQIKIHGDDLIHFHLIGCDSYEITLEGLNAKGKTQGNTQDWKSKIYLTSRKYLKNHYEYLIKSNNLEKEYSKLMTFEFFPKNYHIDKKKKTRMRLRLSDQDFDKIFEFCDIPDLITLEKTCSYFYNSINKNVKIWKNNYPENIERNTYTTAREWKDLIKGLSMEIANHNYGQFYYKGYMISHEKDDYLLYETDIFFINTDRNNINDIEAMIVYHLLDVSTGHKWSLNIPDIRGIEFLSGKVEIEENYKIDVQSKKFIQNTSHFELENFKFELVGLSCYGRNFTKENFKQFFFISPKLKTGKRKLIDTYQLDQNYKNIPYFSKRRFVE